MKLQTLANGARLLVHPMKDTQCATVAVFVNTGSVNETQELNGISHFLEHMAFKGTPTRDYLNISSTAERLGADLNAYTSQQQTVYHVSGLARHVPVFVDLLADIVQNSTLPEDQIEQERGVIIQEYEQYQDSSGSLMMNGLMSATMQPNGWHQTIIGTTDNIKRFQREDFQKYIKDFYTGPNIVIGVAGNVDEDQVLKLLEQAFCTLPTGTFTPLKSPIYTPNDFYLEKDKFNQTKMILAFEGSQGDVQDVYIEQLAMMAMGGGMSSPLFDEIREKRGLAYSVGSSYSSGACLLALHGSTTEENLSGMTEGFAEVMKRMMDSVQDIDLERALNSVIVYTSRLQESRFNLLEQNVSDLFNYGRLSDFEVMSQRFASVTKQDVQDCFARFTKTAPSLSMVGKCGTKDYLEQFKSVM